MLCSRGLLKQSISTDQYNYRTKLQQVPLGSHQSVAYFNLGPYVCIKLAKKV